MTRAERAEANARAWIREVLGIIDITTFRADDDRCTFYVPSSAFHDLISDALLYGRIKVASLSLARKMHGQYVTASYREARVLNAGQLVMHDHNGVTLAEVDIDVGNPLAKWWKPWTWAGILVHGVELLTPGKTDPFEVAKARGWALDNETKDSQNV